MSGGGIRSKRWLAGLQAQGAPGLSSKTSMTEEKKRGRVK